MAKKVLRQPNKVSGEGNACMNKTERRMTVQLNLLIEKKSRWKKPPKKKLLVKCSFLFKMNKAFFPVQRRIVQV